MHATPLPRSCSTLTECQKASRSDCTLLGLAFVMVLRVSDDRQLIGMKIGCFDSDGHGDLQVWHAWRATTSDLLTNRHVWTDLLRSVQHYLSVKWKIPRGIVGIFERASVSTLCDSIEMSSSNTLDIDLHVRYIQQLDSVGPPLLLVTIFMPSN